MNDYPALMHAELLARLRTHDLDTHNHSLRVGRLARLIAQELEISLTHLDEVQRGGELHDLGKITIPTEVLCSPEHFRRCDPVFRELIMPHPIHGVRLCEDGIPQQVLRIIGEHHERLDGTGYPSKLFGSQISELSMIVAVADGYDAMVLANRLFRPRKLPTVALFILHDAAGRGELPVEPVQALEALYQQGLLDDL